jgi:hypothetical protein
MLVPIVTLVKRKTPSVVRPRPPAGSCAAVVAYLCVSAALRFADGTSSHVPRHSRTDRRIARSRAASRGVSPRPHFSRHKPATAEFETSCDGVMRPCIAEGPPLDPARNASATLTDDVERRPSALSVPLRQSPRQRGRTGHLEVA